MKDLAEFTKASFAVRVGHNLPDNTSEIWRQLIAEIYSLGVLEGVRYALEEFNPSLEIVSEVIKIMSKKEN